MAYIDNTWRIFFESFPVIFAFITFILSVSRILVSQSIQIIRMCWLFIASSCILILTQSLWAHALLVSGNNIDIDFFRIVWTIFNSFVMVSMAYAVHWVAKK